VFDVWLSNPNLFCFVRLVCQLSLGLLGVFRSSRRSFDFFAFICGLHGLEYLVIGPMGRWPFVPIFFNHFINLSISLKIYLSIKINQ
jgi:uncharacterized membrane protein YuzA (DUF378 family)